MAEPEFREGMITDVLIRGVRINRLLTEGRDELPVAQIFIPGDDPSGDNGYYTVIPLGWDAVEFHVSEPADGKAE